MYETFHFKINQNDLHYSYSALPSPFAVNRKRATHTEFCHLAIKCTIIHPEKVQGRQVTITIMGSREVKQELEKDVNDRASLSWVGSIDLYRGYNTVYITLPDDKILDIYRLISTGIFSDIIANGTPLKYNRARLRNVHFDSNLDIEEHY